MERKTWNKNLQYSFFWSTKWNYFAPGPIKRCKICLNFEVKIEQCQRDAHILTCILFFYSKYPPICCQFSFRWIFVDISVIHEAKPPWPCFCQIQINCIHCCTVEMYFGNKLLLLPNSLRFCQGKTNASVTTALVAKYRLSVNCGWFMGKEGVQGRSKIFDTPHPFPYSNPGDCIKEPWMLFTC